jgi:hypothetical protein
LVNAIFLDAVQIGDRAGSIFGAVALIQVFYQLTRENIALIAVFESPTYQFFTILDPARQAGLHFLGIIPPTAGAVILDTDIGVTKPAVDATWGDQG